MKKAWIVPAVLAVWVLAGAGAVGSAAARQVQTACPACGGPYGGTTPLHEYRMAAFAEALGVPASELEERIAAGETLYDIALAEGVTAEDFPAFMLAASRRALASAVADGVLTQEQADWMLSRPGQRGSGTGGRMWDADGGSRTPRGSCGGVRWQEPSTP